MTDHSKRKTLKTISLASVVATAGVTSSWAMTNRLDTMEANEGLDQLTLEVSHQSSGENLTVVIKNDSDYAVTITQLTPNKISTTMGDIEFDKVIAKGPVMLPPQGQIQVFAAQDKESNAPAMVSDQFLKSLQRAISTNFSVVTNHNAFAVVNPVFHPQIA